MNGPNSSHNLVELRNAKREDQRRWAEARMAERQQRDQEESDLSRPSSFEIVSHNNNHIAHCDDPTEVNEVIRRYRQNPEMKVLAFDGHGREVGNWDLEDVLNGTFESEVLQ